MPDSRELYDAVLAFVAEIERVARIADDAERGRELLRVLRRSGLLLPVPPPEKPRRT